MAKKTLILLCALALSISAAGCGKNNSSEKRRPSRPSSASLPKTVRLCGNNSQKATGFREKNVVYCTQNLKEVTYH